MGAETDVCVAIPWSGEMISVNDTDGLIDALEDVKRLEESCKLARQAIVTQLLVKTQGIESNTRRVRGSRRVVKLTMPSSTFEQATLRMCWERHPTLRDEFLRISQLAVNLTNYKKAINTAAPADVKIFVSAIQAAERAPTALPTVTIEE